MPTSMYGVPRYINVRNGSGVLDVVKRILGENDEVGPLPNLERAKIFGLEEFRAVLGGGHDDLHRGQTGRDHLLQLEMVEVSLESSRHSGVRSHSISHASVCERLRILFADRQRLRVLFQVRVRRNFLLVFDTT